MTAFWSMLLCVVLLCAAPRGARAAPATNVSDKAASDRIAVLQHLLMRTQSADGSWPYELYPVGATALAVLALRTSGLPADHPSVQRGVDYILTHSDQKVYSESLVPCALEAVGDPAHHPRIARAVKLLVNAQSTTGGWSYACGEPSARKQAGAAERRRTSTYDNSNTQFAVLGLAAAQRCGMVMPQTTKLQALEHWRADQNADGGWGYRARQPTSLSMTCAGIASLHLLGTNLEIPAGKCGRYKFNARLVKALKRLSTQLSGGVGAQLGSHPYYTLYALERVGMLLEFKLIGNTDWYPVGARYLLSRDAPTNVADAAFALLFLAKGAAPIAIAKWRWNGDWNNDHSDVRNWVASAGETLERRLDWIPARLNRLDSPAAKASMIFVNGHRPFSVTDAELAFLRAFLHEGGTLVAEGCCGSKTFTQSFAETVSARLFPNQEAEFTPIRAEHPVCSGLYKLRPEQANAQILKSGCRQHRVVLLTQDISCALNDEDVPDAERERATHLATNLLVWALLDKAADRKLDAFSLREAAALAEQLTVDQIERAPARGSRYLHQPFGRLKHRGDWLADREFYAQFQELLSQRQDLPGFDGEVYVSPLSDDLFHCPLVFINGHSAPDLNEAERLNLRLYLANGGRLVGSACCSKPEFDAGLRELIQLVLPNDTLEEIPEDDPVWHSPFACRNAGVRGTRAYQQQYGDLWAPLLGVRRDGRWIVFYSPVDLCCDIAGDLDQDTVGYKKSQAFRLLANIFCSALTP